jgi:cytochrome b6
MRIFIWLDDRLALQEILDDVSSKFDRGHVNSFYCFGGLVLTSFLVQVATGFALTFYYRPSVSDALASVRAIMSDVHSGWLIRSGHRWGATLMVCCIVLHVCRVYLTGGFKKPREVTWITGVALAVCTVSFGVTGYSLPYDQVGYWALRIVSGVPDCIPLVGQVLVELIRGGPSVGQATLTRFYSLHTFVLPLVTLGLMLMHFLLIRKQGISGPL